MNRKKVTKKLIRPTKPPEKNSKKRTNRPWSDAEFAELEAAVARNAKKRDHGAVAKLARKLKRTPGAVRQKLHAHELRLLG